MTVAVCGVAEGVGVGGVGGAVAAFVGVGSVAAGVGAVVADGAGVTGGFAGAGDGAGATLATKGAGAGTGCTRFGFRIWSMIVEETPVLLSRISSAVEKLKLVTFASRI